MIYLDSAATTFQKPRSVAAAVNNALYSLATPGRGGHSAALRAGEVAFACRELAARLFDVPDAEHVVFTMNATHAVNLAVHSLVGPGDTVLISGYEHNAVTRALHSIPNLRLRVARGPLFQPDAILEQVRALMDERVAAVVCTHVSNVFGYVLPVAEIGALCRERGIPLIIDASQSAGVLPVSLRNTGAAFIAMPGHKALYGPQGTGLLLCGDREAKPILYGGTGSLSMQQEMPDFLPDRLEAGTMNMPGIAGLLAGMRYVASRGTDQIAGRERLLLRRAADGLRGIPGVRVFGDGHSSQTGALSFQTEGKDCVEYAQALAERGIAVRSGLHCAPLAHETAGTLEEGTVRISVSDFNTAAEIDRFLMTVRRLQQKTP